MISLKNYRLVQDLLNFRTKKKDRIVKRVDNILTVDPTRIMVTWCRETEVPDEDRLPMAVYEGPEARGDPQFRVTLEKFLADGREGFDPYIAFDREALLRFVSACSSDYIQIYNSNRMLYMRGENEELTLESVLAPRIEEE